MTRGLKTVYTRDQLLALSKQHLNHQRLKLDLPAELRRRYRGCRAGVRRRANRRSFRPCLPSIVMGNVRSLKAPKRMTELAELAISQREYRECSLMIFTETWLHDNVPDSDVSINGFLTVRSDRDLKLCRKKTGGGLAVLINNKWCNPGHITVKERIWNPDIELMVVSIRPYYLPREYSHVLVFVVYIPPLANAEAACDVIHSAIARYQTKSPSAFMAVSGDFNHASLSGTLPTFHQYVSCSTREDRTLDLFYANVKNAYKCTALPKLGTADHNLVHLTSLYEPMVKKTASDHSDHQKVDTRGQ